MTPKPNQSIYLYFGYNEQTGNRELVEQQHGDHLFRVKMHTTVFANYTCNQATAGRRLSPNPVGWLHSQSARQQHTGSRANITT